MADQDYTQDKGFMSASPEDQHSYLMHADPGYAKAKPEEQKAFISHIRGQGSAAPAVDPSQPGAFQTQKGGKVFGDAAKYLKDQQSADKIGAEATESAVARTAPGGELPGKIGIGALKGLANTGRSLGGLGIRAIRAIAPETGGKLADMWPEAMNGASEQMKPQSLPAKAGFIGEQGAEFALPGGAVSKAAKGAEAGIDAAKLGPVASKALKYITRGGLEGASAAGVTAAQGGSGKDIGANAAVSAVMPAAGAALKVGANALAEKAAPALANKLLRPVPTQIENAARFGRNPGQALADEGIVATSHGDLVSRIGDRKRDVGDRIGQMLKDAPAGPGIDAGKIVNGHIDDAIKDVLSGKMEGGQPLIDRLEEMRGQLTQQRHLVDGKIQNLSAKNLVLPPAEAHALKRQIGDSAKWTGQAFDGEMNQVKRGIYRDLNGEVQKAVPGVKDLQDRYGNLLEAEKAAEREAARHESRNPFSLLDAASSATGAVVGGAHGGAPEAAFLALALPAVRHALQSPLAQTTGVQALKHSGKAVSPEMLRFVRNAAFGAQSENRQ